MGQIEVGPNEAFQNGIRANQQAWANSAKSAVFSNAYGRGGTPRSQRQSRYSPTSPVIKERIEWKKAERQRKLAINKRTYDKWQQRRNRPPIDIN
jgi:hypothetical protein